MSGKYNRYQWLKKFNRNKIVLLKIKNRYISFDRDADLLKYIGFDTNSCVCSLRYFDKFSIDYVVLDGLDIVDNKKYPVNNYIRYIKLMYLSEIINKMIITSNSLL